MAIVNKTLVTGSAASIQVSPIPSKLKAVRVAGTANLAGAVQIRDGSTVIETMAIASTPGTAREFYDTQFIELRINLANAGDTVLVIWEPA